MFANTADAGLIFPIYSIFLLSLVFLFFFSELPAQGSHFCLLYPPVERNEGVSIPLNLSL